MKCRFLHYGTVHSVLLACIHFLPSFLSLLFLSTQYGSLPYSIDFFTYIDQLNIHNKELHPTIITPITPPNIATVVALAGPLKVLPTANPAWALKTSELQSSKSTDGYKNVNTIFGSTVMTAVISSSFAHLAPIQQTSVKRCYSESHHFSTIYPL